MRGDRREWIDIRKIAVSGSPLNSVTVLEAGRFVQLKLSTSSYPAEITPEEARYIAIALFAAAAKADKIAAKWDAEKIAAKGDTKS